MATTKGDPALLNDPVAQSLLSSTKMAHLDYTWSDGTLRVVPIWFYWNGESFLVRGVAEVTLVDGMVPEYVMAAERYFGEEQGQGWAATAQQLSPQMFRIEIRPEWVGILDFEQRFPQALAEAMAAGQ